MITSIECTDYIASHYRDWIKRCRHPCKAPIKSSV